MWVTVLCGRLAVHYWLRDGEDRQGLWKAVDALVRVLLGPRPMVGQGPALAWLGGEHALLIEVVRLLRLFVALLHWRERGGRLPGDPPAQPALLAGSALRGALDVLDRRAGPGDDLVVPNELAALLDESADIGAELPHLRAAPSPGARPRALYTVARRAGQHGFRVPGNVKDDERKMLTDAARGRLPERVAPWTGTCPRCFMALSSMASGDLAARRLARCTNGSCGAWLLPCDDGYAS